MRTSILCFTSLVLLAGCGGEQQQQQQQPIYNASVKQIAVQDLGGGLVYRPPGAGCDPSVGSYTLTIAGHQLGWSYCAITGDGTLPGDYTVVTGARALTAADWKSLEPDLQALSVDKTTTTCGADKPTIQLQVTTDGGTVTYGDAFYACAIKDKPLVNTDTLDRVEEALAGLALAK